MSNPHNKHWLYVRQDTDPALYDFALGQATGVLHSTSAGSTIKLDINDDAFTLPDEVVIPRGLRLPSWPVIRGDGIGESRDSFWCSIPVPEPSIMLGGTYRAFLVTMLHRLGDKAVLHSTIQWPQYWEGEVVHARRQLGEAVELPLYLYEAALTDKTTGDQIDIVRARIERLAPIQEQEQDEEV